MRVLQLVIIKKAAAGLQRSTQVAGKLKECGLGHLKVADVKLTKKKKQTEESAMQAELTTAAMEAYNKLSEQEETRAQRSSLDGEEMKVLWKNRAPIVEALLTPVNDADPQKGATGKSEMLVKAINTMMDPFEKVSAPILATTWSEDRSGEIETVVRAWVDHICDSFGPTVGMPDGRDLCDCIPVHYALCHLKDHAADLWDRFGIAIGCLTDQAGEQYNQLVKRDITPGQGSITNGHMSDKTTDVAGVACYKNNKFWLEMHKLIREFLMHRSEDFQKRKRNFKRCDCDPPCGAARAALCVNKRQRTE
jgi:hypothetical protein